MNLRLSPFSGFACMPLRKHIPDGKPGWKLTTCPECKRECWKTPLTEMEVGNGLVALCTECAICKVMKK